MAKKNSFMLLRLPLFFFVLAVAILENSTAEANSHSQREGSRGLITNGQPVTPGSYPFFAYNKYGNDAGCGATLIHEDILLSAAHCIRAFAGRGAYVGGETNFGTEGDRVEFHEDETVVVHPQYNSSNLVNDIMVVKLQTPSTLPLVSLNTDPTQRTTDIPMVVIGFGDTEFRGDLSPNLLETEVIGFPFETCVRVHLEQDPTVSFDRAAQFCALGNDGRDSCDGDSGGPILIADENNNLVQVGIISLGLGCGSDGIPAIYARVAPYINWIEGQICALSSSPPDWCSTWTLDGNGGSSGGSGGSGALEITAETPSPTEDTSTSDSAPVAFLFSSFFTTISMLFAGHL